MLNLCLSILLIFLINGGLFYLLLPLYMPLFKIHTCVPLLIGFGLLEVIWRLSLLLLNKRRRYLSNLEAFHEIDLLLSNPCWLGLLCHFLISSSWRGLRLSQFILRDLTWFDYSFIVISDSRAEIGFREWRILLMEFQRFLIFITSRINAISLSLFAWALSCLRWVLCESWSTVLVLPLQ